MIKAVLFDLDGTLLPMEEESFIRSYMFLLSKYAAKKNYDSSLLIKAIWSSLEHCIKNDGTRTNEYVFWSAFASILGQRVYDDKPYFNSFYINEFNFAKDSCGFNPNANKTIKALKSVGIDVILATNPIFPRDATLNRARWAGLDIDDFSLITTYENSSFCKPNTKYYEEIISKKGLDPDECLMVGNDAEEDMCAHDIGIDCFLLTDCLINRKNVEIDRFPHGSYDAMWAFLSDKLGMNIKIEEN